MVMLMMDDPSDARDCSGGLEQRPQVFRRPARASARPSRGQSYPVGVEQRVRALEAGRERAWIVEAVRIRLDAAVERAGAVGVAGQRTDLSAPVQQTLGNVPTRIAGSSGDDVGLGHGAWVSRTIIQSCIPLFQKFHLPLLKWDGRIRRAVITIRCTPERISLLVFGCFLYFLQLHRPILGLGNSAQEVLLPRTI